MHLRLSKPIAYTIPTLLLILMVSCTAIESKLGLSIESDLAEISSGEHRTAAHIARNEFRHPVETLAFFELKRESSVVEIWPGAKAWYTEILAPLLKPKGKFYAAHFNPGSNVKYFRDSYRSFEQKLMASPKHYANVNVTAFDAEKHTDISNGELVDRVLTFRNVHNWMKSGKADSAFKAFYDALKPGGILGVVEHRAPENFTVNQMIKSGYVSETKVKELAAEAGFVFVAASEINANQKDTKIYPKGVWTLPPSLRLGETNREKYQAIGESDRMTLKFMKPK